ncbi:MAG: 50S ribosomal protein L23 [Sphaerochaetaceae bacterium]
MRPDQVIIAPVLSEKSNIQRSMEFPKYTFRVDARANKLEICDAVAALYKVNPIKCNVMNIKGKPKFSRGKGGQIVGTTRNWKKAIVTLSKGEAISAFEGV